MHDGRPHDMQSVKLAEPESGPLGPPSKASRSARNCRMPHRRHGWGSLTSSVWYSWLQVATMVLATEQPNKAADQARRLQTGPKQLTPAPLGLRRWFQEATRVPEIEEPNKVVVASADGAGSPSARYVLMKGYDERGIIFYSNYGSRKARELANGRASLCFYWEPLQHQVQGAQNVRLENRALVWLPLHTPA